MSSRGHACVDVDYVACSARPVRLHPMGSRAGFVQQVTAHMNAGMAALSIPAGHVSHLRLSTEPLEPRPFRLHCPALNWKLGRSLALRLLEAVAGLSLMAL